MKNFYWIATLYCIAALSPTVLAQPQQQIDSLIAVSKANPKKDTSKISTLISLARTYQDTDPNIGIVVADQAQAIAKKLNNPMYIAESQIVKGFNLRQLSKVEPALMQFDSARVTMEKLGLKHRTATCLENLAILCAMRGNYATSIENLEKAIKLYTEVDDKKRLAACNEIFGLTHNNMGNYDKALTYYEKAFAGYVALGLTDGYANVTQNIGNIHYQQGNYFRALTAYHQALKYLENAPHKELVPIIETNIGNIYYSLQDYPKALSNYHKAEAAQTQMNSLFELVQTKMNIATIHDMMGNKKMAIEKYLRAMEILEELKDPRNTAICWTNLASAYVDLKDYDKAYEAIQKAEKLTDGNDLQVIRAATGNVYATFLLQAPAEFLQKVGISQANRNTLAEERLKWCLKVHQEAGDLEYLGITWSQLRKLYDQTGDQKKAYTAYKNYILFRDSSAGATVKNQITRKEMEFEFEKERVQKQAAYEAGLNRQKLIQTSLAIGIALLAVILVLAVRAYRSKQKSNTLITAQNEKLAVLNQTKDKLFDIIGHDLRKPALSFKGIAKKVNYLIKTNDVATLNQYGHEIEKNANDMNGLIDNLLGWSLLQKDGIKLRPVNLNLFHAIAETLELLQDLAIDKQIKISNNVPESLMINVDEHSLKIILRNLVHNAIKFTPNGGEIHFSSVTENQTIQLRIRDTGVGMTTGELSEIFKFQAGTSTRGTENEKGTGLGLYIVDQWAKLNKINLLASSEKGKGTTFDLGFALA